MLLVKCELKSSSIQGLGVFLLESVNKGEVVWQYDPRCDIIIPPSTFNTSPESFKNYLKHYGALCYELDGGWLICGDLASFFNHSYFPTLITLPWVCIAAKDLEIGTELTENYCIMEGTPSLRPEWGIE